jgi:hypothetical protein
MSGKTNEKRRGDRRASDRGIESLSNDLSTILKLLKGELKEIDKEVFLIGETSPFLGRRKEDWELQVKITRELKEIVSKLEKVIKKIPGKKS